MSMLSDILKKHIPQIIEDKVNDDKSIEESNDIRKYNHIWLDKVARQHGYTISDNEKRVDNILKKLNDRNGHCPCGGMTDVYICPCKMMRTYGNCKCGLYENIVEKDIDPNGSSAGRIK